MNETGTDLPPVIKEITVPWPIERAFRRFTDEIGTWWPRQPHSVFGKRSASCSLEPEPGGRIFETRDDGEVSVWGTVTEIQPPDLLCFTWHPGREPGTAQRVAVRFTAEGEGTRLVLTHSRWERLGGEAAKTRDGYVQGWDYVLGGYAGGSNA
jgi:uncharacterized protein YndB with AHSA1/START domain